MTTYNPQDFYTILIGVKETTWGTNPGFAGSFQSHPIREPKFQPKGLRHIVDEGLRGQPSVEFDLIPGPGEGSFGWQGDVFVDTFPALLNMMLGADTVSGAGPYTHTIKPSATPPSATFQWQDNIDAWDFAGSRLSELTMSFNAGDGAFTYTLQGMSKLGSVDGSPTTASYTATTALAGWQASVTVGGSAPNSLLEAEISLKRDLRPIHAANDTQDIAQLYPLALQCTGRFTFDFANLNEYTYYLNATKNAVVITFTQGTSSFALYLTSAGWRLANLERNQKVYQAIAQVNGLHNATDGGVCHAVVVNGVSGQY